MYHNIHDTPKPHLAIIIYFDYLTNFITMTVFCQQIIQ